MRLTPLWRLRRGAFAALRVFAVACVVLTGAHATVGAAAQSASRIPRPPELDRDVRFWIRVYSEITTNEGFVHDERNLSVVYETLRFAPNTPPRQRQDVVDQVRDRYVAILRRLIDRLAPPVVMESAAAAADAAMTSGAATAAAAAEAAAKAATAPLTAEEQRVLDAWGAEATPQRLLEASRSIRFQLGQSDRFREGLVRSSAWDTHIAETLANRGLPPELAALPHVESSFNPDAYSKVGAAGLWQFMRSTGRRYMRIDAAVDERLDPFRSTEAAAQLMAHNYRVLGSWPLAITAYNHGTSGMRRAKEEVGTDDFMVISRHYRGRTFGFASRNFFPSFLAALAIDENPEKYFGPLARATEVKFHEVKLPSFVPVGALERVTGLDRAQLRALNPALRPPVWRGEKLVPRGYMLRLSSTHSDWTSERLAERLGAREQYVAQIESRSHVVKRGETLPRIASRYGMSTRALAAMNGISEKSRLRRGKVLRLPDRRPALVAAAAVPKDRAAAAAPTAEPERVGVVTITEVRSSLDADASAESEPAALAAQVAMVAKEQAEDVAAMRKAEALSRRVQPVSAAEAQELGPALGPAPDASSALETVDLSIAKDGSVRVAGGETLGHYAEWLGLGTERLRKLNRTKWGQPLQLGRRLRLDFSRVSREAFEQRRREFHSGLQASYFAAHRIVGTEVYIVRRGDTLWSMMQRYNGLPVWLLQQYNPDVDLGELRAGIEVVVPRVEANATGATAS